MNSENSIGRSKAKTLRIEASVSLAILDDESMTFPWRRAYGIRNSRGPPAPPWQPCIGFVARRWIGRRRVQGLSARYSDSDITQAAAYSGDGTAHVSTLINPRCC